MTIGSPVRANSRAISCALRLVSSYADVGGIVARCPSVTTAPRVFPKAAIVEMWTRRRRPAAAGRADADLVDRRAVHEGVAGAQPIRRAAAELRDVAFDELAPDRAEIASSRARAHEGDDVIASCAQRARHRAHDEARGACEEDPHRPMISLQERPAS